jgi:hypothetical protein
VCVLGDALGGRNGAYRTTSCRKEIVAAHEAKESAQQGRANVAEVEWALRNRIPPSPLSPNTSQSVATSSEAFIAGATI